MVKRYIFRLMLGLILLGFQEEISAGQGSPTPSAEDQKRLEALQPTLKQILDVDPIKVPWGVNLDLVLKRGEEARKQTLDKYDFSSRITLYQKHKSKAKTLSEQYAVLGEQIAQTNDNAEKQLKSLELDSVSALKRLSMKKKIKQDRDAALQPLQEQMAKLRADLQDNTIKMKGFIVTITKKTGLTPDQIARLPDFDSWKKMQKLTPQEVPPPTDLPPSPPMPTRSPPLWKRAQQPGAQTEEQEAAPPSFRPLPPLPKKGPPLSPPRPQQAAG